MNINLKEKNIAGLIMPMFPSLVPFNGYTCSLLTEEGRYCFHFRTLVANGPSVAPTLSLLGTPIFLKVKLNGRSYQTVSEEADEEEAVASFINILQTYKKALQGAFGYEALNLEFLEDLDISDGYYFRRHAVNHDKEHFALYRDGEKMVAEMQRQEVMNFKYRYLHMKLNQLALFEGLLG